MVGFKLHTSQSPGSDGDRSTTGIPLLWLFLYKYVPWNLMACLMSANFAVKIFNVTTIIDNISLMDPHLLILNEGNWVKYQFYYTYVVYFDQHLECALFNVFGKFSQIWCKKKKKMKQKFSFMGLFSTAGWHITLV